VGVDEKTVTDWYNFAHNICSKELINNHFNNTYCGMMFWAGTLNLYSVTHSRQLTTLADWVFVTLGPLRHA